MGDLSTMTNTTNTTDTMTDGAPHGRSPAGKPLPRGGLDPLNVTDMLPDRSRVHSFLRLPPGFEMPLREIGATGTPLKNWCGLHALWLFCHFMWPGKWNVGCRPPSSAKAEEVLGLNVPNRLAWTALRVGRAPSYFRHHGATLFVNGHPVRTYPEFFRRVAFGWLRMPPFSAEEAEDRVIDLVRGNQPAAVDLTLPGWFREHVAFVYGACSDGFLLVDSLVVPGVGYRKVTPEGDPRLIMLLPFEEFRRRWGRGSGIWHAALDGDKLCRLA